MSFQTIIQVEKPQFYIDICFKRAEKKASLVRSSSKFRGDRLKKSKKIELIKLDVIKDGAVAQIDKILHSFPQLDDLTVFYQQLVRCFIDYGYLKKSLGALNWAKKKINEFCSMYKGKIQRTNELKIINKYRKEFYGRFSSVFKQIKKQLAYLEESRRILKSFPTIAIAGFPNVGKTTLLFNLTGSKPEINSYPFTTKNINVSYMVKNKKKIQLLDTPGTLNRFNKMNFIEKQSYLAMKYCADQIIYVFDLTEPYPLNDQLKLYRSLKKFDKKILVHISKKDIVEEHEVERFMNKHHFDYLE